MDSVALKKLDSYISKLGWFQIAKEFMGWCSSLRHPSPNLHTDTQFSRLYLQASKMCFFNPMLFRYLEKKGFSGQIELGSGASQTGFSRIQTLRCVLPVGGLLRRANGTNTCRKEKEREKLSCNAGPTTALASAMGEI